MSSMFKKKGGPAFKPKIPSARPRVPSSSAPKPVDRRPSIDAPAEALPHELPDSLETASQPPPSERPPSPEKQKRTSKSDTEPSQPPQEPVIAAKVLPQSHEQPRRASTSRAAPDAQEQASAPPSKIPTEAEPLLPSIETGRGATEQAPTPTSPSQIDTIQETSAARATVETCYKSGGQGENPSRHNTTAGWRQGRKREAKEASTQSLTTKRRFGAAEARKRQASSSTGDGSETKPRPRRARSLTPEDAESQLVDLQQLRMADLTKDLRIGKKFSRHDELRERERQARLKAKLGKDGDQTEREGSASASPMPDGRTKKSATPGGSSTPAPASGPQFRIVDGQIVVDQSSLVMDRHARAAAAQAGEDMETIEENDFTRLITSSSFMNTSKLKGPNIWTDQETELFYRGLRMFGTEFEMISKMFPGKQRRHVKLKFNREERHNPKRIDAALIGEKTIKMDIAEYKAFTGAEYESVETIEAEQRKIQEGYEAERQRIADEQEEIMRKKREELFADEDGDEMGGKKKKGKKKGKQAIQYGLNGEPITQDA
ncbi:hypothetical protein ACCO45_001494 [Purpureocillium lilacinum]|uniref:Uncharacterized protein n=1 Tax=Purpureocillium lilacinum TaxID=33203 RepID=A0ACC4E9Y6_PURLI